MAKCKRCGKETNNSHFCSNCGLEQNKNDIINNNLSNSNQSGYSKSGVVLAIILCVCFFYSMFREPSTTYSDNVVYESPTTFELVESWFENQKNGVKDNFKVYLSNYSDLISNIKVTDIEFEFSRELGCYYILYFDCKVDNQSCNGHARAFLEYEGDTVYWWSLEIDYKNMAIIDFYENKYEDIVENYYIELEEKYN